MSEDKMTKQAETAQEVTVEAKPDDEVTLEYDQISPAPDGADCILHLSLKKGGKGVPRTTIVLRDVHAGTTKHVMTEADGNVLLPITATDTNEMLLLASSPDPFVERWVHLFFFKDTRDQSRERTVAQYAGKPNRWGLRD
jgi:hypothetical protein